MSTSGASAEKAAGARAMDAGKRAADSAEDAGQQAIASKPFRVLLTVGLVCYGVVHILIGWIALQIAWSGRGESQEASQKGALAELSSQPFGAALLWIVVVGLFALTIWQGVEAIWGHRDRPAGVKRIRKQLGSAGRAVSYAVIAIAAISAATGSSNEPGTRTTRTCVTFAAASARWAPARRPSMTSVCQLAATTVTRSPVPSTVIWGAPAPLIGRSPRWWWVWWGRSGRARCPARA